MQGRAAMPSTHQQTCQPETTAVLIGGPAAGRHAVPIIAGHWPRYLGVGGANYLRDHSADGVRPVYRCWPAGADRPARRS